MSKPVVWVLGTGGTIASKDRREARRPRRRGQRRRDDRRNSRADRRRGDPRGRALRINSAGIDTATVFGLRDRLVKVLADPNVAGAVITHGTATLEETAYMMDLLVDSPKPVVVTGAQRNFDAKDADGPRKISMPSRSRQIRHRQAAE